MIETGNGKVQFRIELILALIITGLACVAGFSNLLFLSNDLYPYTSDAMGHLAKVRYLADCFSNGEFPSWFPYWYNGTTVTQYYPPLSYWMMALIYIPVQNVMLTFKIYCFIMIFTGGIGVWHLCRIYVGRWCGLFGTAIFCLQPFILRSFFSAGLIAQGPIIALAPWYLAALLAFWKRPDRKQFFLITVLCVMMILSHPNTTFMICFCLMVVFFVILLFRRITIQSYLYLVISIVFAGILTAFWSFVGVTGLENPGIPYLLPEAALAYTANMKWFITSYSTFFYFAVPVSLGSILAALLFAHKASRKETGHREKHFIYYFILLTFFTMLFSFGMNLPFFEYLPLAESYVPGRILVLTSVTGAILCSYFIFEIHRTSKSRKLDFKIYISLVNLSIIGATLFYLNPFQFTYGTISDYEFNDMFSTIDTQGSNFEKGRYSYVGEIDSSETFFPISYNFNISDGWNIEGTPHNHAIWNHVIANPSDGFDYIAKNLAFWNVRNLLLDKKYERVVGELNKRYTFQYKDMKNEYKFYSSDYPSSYFLTDHRNSLLLGAGSPGLAIEFPYFVYEQRNDLFDYSLEELEKYKLIYLCEPAVDTIREKEKTEGLIEELIDRGVTVVIEPTNTKGYQLFDVAVSEVVLEGSPTIRKQPGSKINSTADGIEVDESMRYGRAMFGLDEVYYKLIQNKGSLENEIIGIKRTGNGEVVFIGKHLSQYLKAVYTRNWGVPENATGYPECSEEVKALFTDIFKTYGVNTNFWPEPFPVKKADWNYKGVDFEYSSQKAQEMTLSVTYAPRWKATLDGKPIAVGQKENLITLNLPAGEHEVELVYGLTKYGIAGYIISLVGLLLFVSFIKYYGIITYRFRQISIKFDKYLQLDQKE